MRVWVQVAVLLLAAQLRWAWPQPAASPRGPALLPKQPRAVCDGGCYGYSPTTRLWVCATEAVGSGEVGDVTHRCAIELRRDSLALGRLLVYKGTNWRTEAPPGSALPLTTVAALVPPDMSPLLTLELPLGKDVTLPNSGHMLRLRPQASEPSGRKRRNALPVQVVLRCKSSCSAASPRPMQADNGKNAVPTEAQPTEIVVHEGTGDCGLTEQYQIQLSPYSTQIALIDRRSYGCVDYHVDEKQVHIVDVQRLCRTGEDSPK